MTGTAVTHPPVAAIGGAGGGVVPGNEQTLSAKNLHRLYAVIQRLKYHVRGIQKWTSVDFLNLCLAFARGIDFAIANNDIPSKSQDLPQLIKLVCQDMQDPLLLSAYMVLMISVKSACNNGWFSEKDSEDLKNLAKEIASKFGSASDFKSPPSCPLDVISTIMSRFYPKMRMGHIFVVLEVKPGFEAYVADFQISKNRKPSSAQEKASLFVAQTDNTETSACLISPAKANFLLNGKGVARRINSNLDTGPQIPTIVNNYLKYGSNLLQAVGEFTGNYVVAVVFMTEQPNPDSSALQDYEQQSTAVLDSDSEIIEGSSRVSLNCPISHQRIKTPVKGHSCHHVQCFDFNNYVEINSRRPNWRCPSCNQPVCFSDIRIDRKMMKVLEEVGPNVSNILISSDGLWNAEVESDNALEKSEGDKTGTGTGKPTESSVLDLTQVDDPMDSTDTSGTQDTKNALLFTSQNTTNSPIVNRNDFNQSSSPIPEDFWTGFSLPGIDQPNAQVGCGPAPTLPIESFNFPIVGFEPFQDLPLTTSQNETPLSITLPLQQQQHFGDGRFQFMTGNVIRTPNGVQALPAATPNHLLQQTPLSLIPNNFSAALQAQISPAAARLVQTPPVVQRSPRNSPNANFSNAYTESSQALPPPPGMPSPFHVQSSAPVHQQASRNSASTFTSNGPASQSVPNVAPSLHVNPRHASQVSINPMAQQRHVQTTPTPHQPNQQNRYPVAQQQHHQNTGFRNPTQVQNALRVSDEHRASSQQMANAWIHPTLIRSSVTLQNSVSRPNHSGNRGVHENGSPILQQAQLLAAANRTAQMATESIRPSQSLPWNNPDVSNLQLPGDQRAADVGVATSQAATITADPNDRNWQPAGRMRGALTGPAYANAFNKFIVRPSQQAQAARSFTSSLSLPSDISSQLQSIMSGGVTPATMPPQTNHSSAGPASASDSFVDLDRMP